MKENIIIITEGLEMTHENGIQCLVRNHNVCLACIHFFYVIKHVHILLKDFEYYL